MQKHPVFEIVSLCGVNYCLIAKFLGFQFLWWKNVKLNSESCNKLLYLISLSQHTVCITGEKSIGIMDITLDISISVHLK